MSRLVVGIDPSLTSTGIAFAWDGKVHRLYSCKSASTGESVKDRAERIDDLASRIVLSFGWRVKVDAFVIEGPSHNSRFGKPHERAGLWWAVASRIPLYYDAPIYEVAPQSRAKYATGKGNDKKAVVYAATKETYGPLLGTLKLANNDEGDALLLAAMGARVLGEPVEAAEPSEGQLAALTSLREQVHGAR